MSKAGGCLPYIHFSKLQYTGFMDLNFSHTHPEIESRIEPLLSRMTLEEKIGQLVQLAPHDGPMDSAIQDGRIGSVLGICDIDESNRLQKIALEKSRLGIPLLMALDVIHGYRTIFPIPLAASCSWNPELIEKSASIAAQEASAAGIHWTYAPMVDVSRDPRWGRIAESAGEDPLINALMARAYVRGFQNPRNPGTGRLLACAKHFAAYGAAESGKDYNTVDVSERTLRDVYFPPFKAALEEGVASFMAAFNELSGIPASAHSFLLQTVLRQEWGFQGIAVSDYSAILEMINHGYAQDLREAAEKSMQAGLDIDMMSNAYNTHLKSLVTEKRVSQNRLDEAVRRVLRLKFSLGLFEKPYAQPDKTPSGSNLPEHFRKTAASLAVESIVLLKNENNILPLNPGLKTIALVGPLAQDKLSPLGSWHCQGRSEETVSLSDALKENPLLSKTQIRCALGCAISGDDTSGFKEALAIAKNADLIIAAMGEDWRMSGEAHSRACLNLPGVQPKLLDELASLGIPLILVLMSGRPLVLRQEAEKVSAILQAWQLGTESGNAIADILTGKANPSGRLTVSFPICEGQIPVYYSYKNTGRPVTGEGTLQFNIRHKSNYMDIPNRPLFPFGFGLSYTTFLYRNLEIETPRVNKNQELRVSVTIQNTGGCDGIETVQFYVRDRFGSITRPVKELKGFQRIALKAGEERIVSFTVPVKEFGFAGQDMAFTVEEGRFDVWIGPNCEEGLNGTFEVIH